MATRRRLEAGLQAGLFLLFLALPAADGAFDLDPTRRPPNQARAEAPNAPSGIVDLEAWRDGFEAHLNDSFGWRSWSVRTFNRLNYRVFGLSQQRNVVVGRDGWLFFGGAATEYQRANQPFSTGELRRRSRLLERRRRWLAERGIPYFFAVAPNKHSIYPEYLPGPLLRTGSESRFEQLATHLEIETEVQRIDLHQPLIAAKAARQVYERTGTHWNSYGAYVAYRAVHRRLVQALPEIGPAIPWERIELTQRGAGELVRMLGLEGLVDEEREIVAGGVEHTRLSMQRRGRVTTRQPDANLPRAVILHDSFAIALAPYLAEHFSEAVFQWRSSFDGDLIAEVMPDVVIEQRVERNLQLPPFSNILPPWPDSSSPEEASP